MKLKKVWFITANLFFVITFYLNVQAIPGDLDPTFDSDGKVMTSIGAMDYGNDVAIQPDGKIVVTGVSGEYVNGVFTGDVSLARYNADGSLDSSFGTGGKVLLVESGHQTSGGLIIQPDGKIIVLVGGQIISQSVLKVYRFNPDGSLDTTFGTNGKVSHNVEQGSAGSDSVLQPDGKIVISGIVQSGGAVRSAVFRLNTDGALDAGFNAVGYAIAPPAGGNNTYAFCVVLQSDGKIVFGGYDGNQNRGYWGRFNSDGTFEGSSLTASDVLIQNAALQPDGKIVFVGYTRVSGTGITNFSITRFNSDKTLDVQFGNVGVNSVNWGTGSGTIHGAKSVFIQPSGRIVVGGYAYFENFDFALARFNRNGFLDSGFGDNGKVITRFNQGWEEIKSIAQQADGKIVAVGNASDLVTQTYDFAIARYDGSDSNTIGSRTPFDFDGDGRADISVFRPGTNIWYHLFSGNSSIGVKQFGSAGDIIAPADYDGDAKTDFGVFRPSTGQWWYLASSNNTVGIIPWGLPGDLPLPANFDGDGKADLIVYRPSNNSWIRRGSAGQSSTIRFGIAEDIPLAGDFDGDARSDPAIFRPGTGDWWYAASSEGGAHRTVQWGAAGDIPVPGDYDGDGKADFVVFRPTDGGWYILYSTGSYTIATFGTAGDKPVAADYDGDGKTDIAVFRPSTGTWYLLQTTAGFGALQWGVSTDVPIQNAFVR
jgi:uncharacterized delta-60 repeat protein